MTLIEGRDYFVRYLPLDNTKNPAVVCMNDDGTFDIYLNSLCSDEKCREGLEHELRHIELDHFYSDKDIYTIEAEAHGKRIVEPYIGNQKGYITEFNSLEAFNKYIQWLCELKHVKLN